MLRLLAAGVCLLAVSVAKSGIHSQRNVPPGSNITQLIDHIGRTAIHVNIMLDHQRESVVVKDIGRKYDRRRVATGLITGCKSSVDLACAHGIDQTPVTSDEVKNRDI